MSQLNSDELSQTIYDELRKIAGIKLRVLGQHQSLHASDVVHEAYLRLRKRMPELERTHFLRLAGIVMWHVLLDHMKSKRAQKHGGNFVQVSMEFAEGKVVESDIHVEKLHAALEQLQVELPDNVELLLWRYFAGLTIAEIAALRQVSVSKIEREWRFTRAWLETQLSKED